jgi:FkbM family methyltransferase
VRLAAIHLRGLTRVLGPEARTEALDRWLVEVERRVCTVRLGRLVAACFRDRIPNHGHRIRADAPSVSPQAKASILLHLYERREISLLRRYLRPDLDVIDGGGSLGVTGAIVASRLRPGRRLVAVEANPELIPRLRHNLEAAAGNGCVIGVHAALGHPPLGGGPEAAPSVFVAGADSVLGSVTDDPAAGEPIPAVTLDELRRTWGLDRYALICDIEGGERALIAQPAGVFAGCEQLFIELHGRDGEDDSQALLQRLTEVHGFLPVARRGAVHHLVLRGTQTRRGRSTVAGRRAAAIVAVFGMAALGTWCRRRRRS